jgi:hypothetical protein
MASIYGNVYVVVWTMILSMPEATTPSAHKLINVNQNRRTLHRRIMNNTKTQHMHLCSHRSATNVTAKTKLKLRDTTAYI